MNAQYEQLDLSFMGCNYFVHVTQGMDWEAPDYLVIGDYLLPDENDADYFCRCVRTRGLYFALSEYNPHKMSESDWERYDSMILAIAR